MSSSRRHVSPTAEPALRDVGGAPTLDGGFLRRGLLYRAPALAELGPAERDLLGRTRLRLCVDLRASFEVVAAGNGALANVAAATERVPVVDADDAAAYLARLGRRGPGVGLEETYRFLLDEGAPAFARAVRLLAHRLPAVICCSTGANRTGLLAALVQRVCGVDTAHVVMDWATGMSTARTTRPIEAALTHLERLWNGAEGYLLAAGVEAKELDALRTVLVADRPPPPLVITVDEPAPVTP